MQPITSWFQHLTSLVNSVIASLHKSAPIIFPPVTSHKVRKFFMHHPSCFKPKRSSMLIPMRWNLKTQAKWPMVWLKPTLVDQSGLFESQSPLQIYQAMVKPYPHSLVSPSQGVSLKSHIYETTIMDKILKGFHISMASSWSTPHTFTS